MTDACDLWPHDRDPIQDRRRLSNQRSRGPLHHRAGHDQQRRLRSLDDMFKLERDTPEEMGRRVSLFRRQAALVHEAATFITATAMALAEFAQRAAQPCLEARPAGTFTVERGADSSA
jgi:hypothetical protein